MSRPRIIMTCKQVSRCLHESHYSALPWNQKMLVKFHLSWCWICGMFNKQVIEMQDGVDQFLSHEGDDPVPEEMRLSDECKAKVLDAVRESGA